METRDFRSADHAAVTKRKRVLHDEEFRHNPRAGFLGPGPDVDRYLLGGLIQNVFGKKVCD